MADDDTPTEPPVDDDVAAEPSTDEESSRGDDEPEAPSADAKPCPEAADPVRTFANLYRGAMQDPAKFSLFGLDKVGLQKLAGADPTLFKRVTGVNDALLKLGQLGAIKNVGISNAAIKAMSQAGKFKTPGLIDPKLFAKVAAMPRTPAFDSDATNSLLRGYDPHPEYKLLREQTTLLEVMTDLQRNSLELMSKTGDMNEETLSINRQMASSSKWMMRLTIVVCIATLFTLAVSAATCSRTSQTVVVRPVVTLAPSAVPSASQP